MRRLSSAFTSFSFACSRLRIVCRRTVNRPLLLFLSQMCVKPRKLNVSGFPSPRCFRFLTANGPNSSRRVFSGCSSRSNFRIRSVSSAQNCLASDFFLESNDDVVSKPHDDYITVGLLSTPRLNPQVEYIVEIDVGQQRRCTAALGRSFFHTYPLSILQHASIQPFLDEPHNASVRNSMLDELHQPFVGNFVEKAANVQIKRPAHFSRQQSGVERIQCLMLASLWPEPVRETEKIRLVDGVQHLDHRTLGDLVFQRRDSKRSLPPVSLGDVHPTHRLRSVRSSLQPFGEVLEIFLQRLAVVPPRLPVHARRGFLLQSEVCLPKRFEVVDVVQKRREPQLLIPSCCLTYPLQRTGRVFPARCPGRVLLWQVPFGQTSSLHPLRDRLPGFVRRLLRYYRSVRLPLSVRHRRTSLDFPMRPEATAALGGHGISRFPCVMFP